jgi:hypothetical protein
MQVSRIAVATVRLPMGICLVLADKDVRDREQQLVETGPFA